MVVMSIVLKGKRHIELYLKKIIKWDILSHIVYIYGWRQDQGLRRQLHLAPDVAPHTDAGDHKTPGVINLRRRQFTSRCPVNMSLNTEKYNFLSNGGSISPAMHVGRGLCLTSVLAGTVLSLNGGKYLCARWATTVHAQYSFHTVEKPFLAQTYDLYCIHIHKTVTML